MAAVFSLQPHLGPSKAIMHTAKSPDLYFEDGNIVLVVESTAFRVYGELLAKYSPIFMDMLQIGCVEGMQGQDTFEGCSAVQLWDRSDEAIQLLRAIHGQFNFDSESVTHLAQVLRLSTKYLMEPIRVTVMKKLTLNFPSKLSEWSHITAPLPEQCADIIRTALETDADILLPAAFYALCRVDVDQVFRLDLPPYAMQAYFEGRHDLERAVLPLLADIIDRMPAHYACDDTKKCTQLMLKLKNEVLEILRHKDYSVMPFEIVTSLTLQDSVMDQCIWCRGYLKGMFSAWLLKTWLELPLFFRLPSWTTLENNSKSALC
ncbi:hypothetical protein M422DRAFT_259185 [Sphaerobolus stellatus SS14]|uniref:BTB domain-containing protein n=1 Tax=Sphaerobolus stellatus (strain SS14) TaxID=990650 RepID=A0A0C9U5K9_SPHS4|nr:hypothetical protein M422DRAFT_259185 [Sphaerobolus stellatus SS14]